MAEGTFRGPATEKSMPAAARLFITALCTLFSVDITTVLQADHRKEDGSDHRPRHGGLIA
jgi:hypothetical protein